MHASRWPPSVSRARVFSQAHPLIEIGEDCGDRVAVKTKENDERSSVRASRRPPSVPGVSLSSQAYPLREIGQKLPLQKKIKRSGFSGKHLLGTRKTRHTVRPFKVMSNNYHFHKNETSSHYSNNDGVKVIAAENKKKIVCNCGLKPS